MLEGSISSCRELARLARRKAALQINSGKWFCERGCQAKRLLLLSGFEIRETGYGTQRKFVPRRPRPPAPVDELEHFECTGFGLHFSMRERARRRCFGVRGAPWSAAAKLPPWTAVARRRLGMIWTRRAKRRQAAALQGAFGAIMSWEVCHHAHKPRRDH